MTTLAKRARRVATPLVAIAILAIDYAALDDITTGAEPDLSLEWIVLAVSAPLLAALARARRADVG